MAELDPLIAEILLKGDTEFISSIKKIGEEGAESFEKLTSAFEKGATSFALAGLALSGLEKVISGVTAATTQFIEEQTELTQKTALLADAFGVTAGQLQDIEATFAGAGVKVEQFERFANRLTITIAREWPQIAESIKTYATENDAATLRVSTAIQRVREAQTALSENSSERFAQMSRDSNALEAAYIKLTFAAQHAASEQLGAAQSVRGAELGVLSAVQALATAKGTPPSASEKESLAIAQAQQAVDTARKAEADARLAQQEKAAQASLKQRQLEQDVEDLARRAAKNAREDIEQRIKDQNAVKEAIIQRAEAEQRAEKVALSNIASIRDALDGIVAGNKEAAKSVNLAEVSVQHLTNAIIAQAKEGNKNPDKLGYETLIQLSRTFAADTDHLITRQQRLAIVNRLAGTSMQALGASASEILHVLEHNTGALEHLNAATKELDTKKARDDLEHFRGALANLNLTISILSQRFALAIAPAFTVFLNGLRDSIESNTGLLHGFIDGLSALGAGLSAAVKALADTATWFAKLFGGGVVEQATILKGIIIGIGVAITLATGPIGVMVVAVGLVITAVGLLRANWEKIVDIAGKAWEKVKDNAIIKFLTTVVEIIGQIIKGLAAIDRATAIKLPSSGQANTPSEGGDVKGHATGGPIDGPGTTTSDSILARLSRGEFVIKAAAVQQYGTGLFHALNNMQLPGFAQGGGVAAPSRLTGGLSNGPTSTLNLTIGERTFNGLRGPKSTIDDLANYAVSRQTSAAGSKPSWVG